MFNYDIKYERETTNVKANILSKNPIFNFNGPLNLLLNDNSTIEM